MSGIIKCLKQVPVFDFYPKCLWHNSPYWVRLHDCS